MCRLSENPKIGEMDHPEIVLNIVANHSRASGPNPSKPNQSWIKPNQENGLGFSWIPSSDSGLFNGLRAIPGEKISTPTPPSPTSLSLSPPRRFIKNPTMDFEKRQEQNEKICGGLGARLFAFSAKRGIAGNSFRRAWNSLGLAAAALPPDEVRGLASLRYSATTSALSKQTEG